MLRRVCLPVFVSISIFTALPAQGAILSALPKDPKEYEKVFGYEPTGGELDTVRRSLRTEYGQQIQTVKTLSDFQRVLDSSEQPLVLVGHNEEGVFRFASGESRPIDQLSKMVEESDKIGVFLTCRGSCYTDAPAPRFKINWVDALILAAVINRAFADFDPPSGPGPVPPRSGPSPPSGQALSSGRREMPPRSGPFASSSPPTLSECAQGIRAGRRGTGGTNQARIRFYNRNLKNQISRLIFQKEMAKIVSTKAKIVAATTTGGTVIWGVFHIFLSSSTMNGEEIRWA